jgi:DNA repair protein RadC
MTSREPALERPLLLRPAMKLPDALLDPGGPGDPPLNVPSDPFGDPTIDPLDDLSLVAQLTDDRPRERLWRLGTQAISDAELVAILLGSGVRARPVLAVAADLVQSLGGVTGLSRASPHELAQIVGIGAARAAQLAAAFELGRRAVEAARHPRVIGEAGEVYRYLAPRLSGVLQEVVLVVGVDTRNRLLDVVEVARGTVAHVEIHPREVFRPLIRMAASGGVLVHNHPSGDPSPSRMDREITREMRIAGHVVGIPIIDHVIVGDGAYRSGAEWMGTDF